MKHLYKTKGICASSIEFEIDEGVVKNVRFNGGCNGNLKGISQLVEGMEINEVKQRLSGIKCDFKATSCPDQLAKALGDLCENS